MCFILSKILLFLIFPLLWVFVLLLVSLFCKDKKRKRRFLLAAVIVLFLFSNSFLFNVFAKGWDISAYNPKLTTKYSCAIVLGGFSGPDQFGNGHFNANADRFIQGVKLLVTGKVSHLLISGGSGSLLPGTFKEGDWAKTQLEELKIADSAVLVENRSRNTIENARFSNVILKQSHLPGPYLLITSAFHMRRAKMIFKKEGVNVVPYSCNFIAKQDKYTFDDFFIPSVEVLAGWSYYIKEMTGYATNYFNG
jgi:uncharacterized SAM-binding protein YcdF (DUF218 family)